MEAYCTQMLSATGKHNVLLVEISRILKGHTVGRKGLANTMVGSSYTAASSKWRYNMNGESVVRLMFQIHRTFTVWKHATSKSPCLRTAGPALSRHRLFNTV